MTCHVFVVSEPHHGVLLVGRSVQFLLYRFDGSFGCIRSFLQRTCSLRIVLESLWSNALVFMPYPDIFIFPFSLWVGRLLGFKRGECPTESPLLGDSLSDWSFSLCLSFGPFSRNEIRLSSRAPISSSSGGRHTLGHAQRAHTYTNCSATLRVHYFGSGDSQYQSQ